MIFDNIYAYINSKQQQQDTHTHTHVFKCTKSNIEKVISTKALQIFCNNSESLDRWQRG